MVAAITAIQASTDAMEALRVELALYGVERQSEPLEVVSDGPVLANV